MKCAQVKEGACQCKLDGWWGGGGWNTINTEKEKKREKTVKITIAEEVL